MTVAVLLAVALVVAVLFGPDDAKDDGSAHAEPTTTVVAAPASTAPFALPGGLAPLAVAEPSHADSYDRDLFTHWIDADGDCQDTRAEVLVVESRVPVTFTSASSCTVSTGDWLDPWSGAASTTARALDVDHTVPLANAWRSGAWSWTPEQRRAFANDLSDAPHLVAIPLGENRAKGDKGPEAWRPPSRSAWCEYARAWTAIKARWSLTASPSEWSALVEMGATC